MGKWYFQKYEKKYDGFGVDIVPKNITLCKYFWSVVLCCGIFHGMVLIKEVLVPFWDFLDNVYNKRPIKIKWPEFEVNIKYVKIICAFALFGVGISHYLNQNYWMMGLQFGIALFILGGNPIIYYLIENRHKRVMLKMVRGEEKKPQHHNLALEYFKARKGKYCPILQFYEPVNKKDLR